MNLLIKSFTPPVQAGVRVIFEGKGVAGRLEFNTLKTEGMPFQEGDPVTFFVAGEPFFSGRIFSKRRKKENIISCTAFDNLRYLKGKDSYYGKNKKASEILRELAGVVNLSLGDVADTGYTFPEVIEENNEIFNIITKKITETEILTGHGFTLLDEKGKICLRRNTDLRTDYILSSKNAEDFDYQSTINNDTFNKIKIWYGDFKKGLGQFAEASGNVDTWGVLQHAESAKNKDEASQKAKAILTAKNRKKRTLTVQRAIGDVRVKAGSSIFVKLELGDINVNQMMIVNRVEHSFSENEHFMNLNLVGDNFN